MAFYRYKHMIKTKTDAIDLIYSSYNFAKQKSKQITRNKNFSRELLDSLGAPDKNKRIILVTGSKGKGSTATFISSLLHQLGYTTGLFTSPHYFSFNERIQINGTAISDFELIQHANEVAPFVTNIMNRLLSEEYLGPIAITLAIAMLYFAENKVDYIILEAGKGGKMDDTNIVRNQWAVITPILYEHVEELGPTQAHIIEHKLGIIKKDSTTLISKQQKAINCKITKFLKHREKVYSYDQTFSVLHSTMSHTGMTFDFQTKRNLYKNKHVPLFGTFQCENIALAVQTCEEVIDEPIADVLIQHWLQTLENSGKCELLLNEPLVFADATINQHSANYLREVITHFSPENVVVIIGLSTDKDYEGVIETLSPFTNKFIISEPSRGYKSFCKEKTYQYASQFSPSKTAPSPGKAIKLALNQADNECIFIIGNHSFIAEAKQLFEQTIIVPV